MWEVIGGVGVVLYEWDKQTDTERRISDLAVLEVEDKVFRVVIADTQLEPLGILDGEIRDEIEVETNEIVCWSMLGGMEAEIEKIFDDT